MPDVLVVDDDRGARDSLGLARAAYAARRRAGRRPAARELDRTLPGPVAPASGCTRKVDGDVVGGPKILDGDRFVVTA